VSNNQLINAHLLRRFEQSEVSLGDMAVSQNHIVFLIIASILSISGTSYFPHPE